MEVSETNVNHCKNNPSPQCQVYAKRWLILGIFVLYSASNSSQWVQYTIIENIVEKFYKVSATTVSWTSMIYMVTYIAFILPANYLLERKVYLSDNRPLTFFLII